ncbi:c-type cytochrome [Neobacillus sp. PS3-12]|uniref:c-type cytochrome n=1 Tax=Neobacillus sp. PS3-12 TaxID=3070677 RepID=UPI0027DFC811|nr:c-type cytochrome [Neobacillus sp. PS3-12]WML54025.1 c-type cytochrome [Neobacillus sp. PS3-12]
MKKVLIGLYLIIIVGIFTLLFSNDLKEKKNKVVSAGEKIFGQQCITCHGETGKGEGTKTGTALNNQHFLNTISDKDLKNYIKYGLTGTEMPSYQSISKKDMNNLVTYIRNWQTENITLSTPKNIKGNVQNGIRLYKTYCLTCHGENAAGMQKMGPSLSNAEYLKYTSDEQIWITTAYGREDTRMGPSLKGQEGVRQLKENDVSDIVSYIRSLQKK